MACLNDIRDHLAGASEANWKWGGGGDILNESIQEVYDEAL